MFIWYDEFEMLFRNILRNETKTAGIITIKIPNTMKTKKR